MVRFEFSILEVENLDRPADPLKLTLQYTLPDSFHRIGPAGEQTLVGRLPSGWESRYLQVEYLENRETPFEIGLPVLVESSVRIHVPHGYALLSTPPSNSSGQTPYAAWASSSGQIGNIVNIEYRGRAAAGRHAPAAYSDYYAAMKRSLAPLQTPLTIREAIVETAARQPEKPAYVR